MLKKLMTFMLIFSLMLAVASCGNGESNENSDVSAIVDVSYSEDGSSSISESSKSDGVKSESGVASDVNSDTSKEESETKEDNTSGSNNTSSGSVSNVTSNVNSNAPSNSTSKPSDKNTNSKPNNTSSSVVDTPSKVDQVSKIVEEVKTITVKEILSMDAGTREAKRNELKEAIKKGEVSKDKLSDDAKVLLVTDKTLNLTTKLSGSAFGEITYSDVKEFNIDKLTNYFVNKLGLIDMMDYYYRIGATPRKSTTDLHFVDDVDNMTVEVSMIKTGYMVCWFTTNDIVTVEGINGKTPKSKVLEMFGEPTMEAVCNDGSIDYTYRIQGKSFRVSVNKEGFVKQFAIYW